MGVKYKLNDSGGNAVASLLLRVLKMVFISTIFVMAAFFLLGNFTTQNFLIAESTIVVVSLVYYMTKREVTEVVFEDDELVLTGRTCIFFPFTDRAEYAKVRYKFKKTGDRRKKQQLFARNPSLTLFRHKSRWVQFTPMFSGWKRGVLADVVKELIARGCYNWFDFHKKR